VLIKYLSPCPLTAFERKVAELTIGGWSVQSIAYRLGRRPAAVRRAYAQVCLKFDTRSVYAIELKLRGIVPEHEGTND
jgi:DNA-binding NarL/FixJ family response regulator